MRKLIVLPIIILLSLTNIFGQVSWLGGTGDWDDPSNWSSGTVPTLQDDVEIHSGSVTIRDFRYEEAKSVLVNFAATLHVEVAGILVIADAIDRNGIENRGTIINHGYIYISNVQSTVASTNVGNGLYNQGNFYVTATATMVIEDVAYKGIFNDFNTSLHNAGIILIGVTGSEGIYNLGEFENYATGLVSVSDTGGTAVRVELTGSKWENAGVLNIENAGQYGITLYANEAFSNLDGGIIYIDDTNFAAIYLTLNSTLSNHAGGDISILNTNTYDAIVNIEGSFHNAGTINFNTGIGQVAIDNAGSFVNYDTGILSIASFSGVAVNNVDAYFENNGLLIIDDSGNGGYGGIRNEGEFQNTTTGNIQIQNTANHGVTNHSVFINQGQLTITEIGGNGISNSALFSNRQHGVVNIDHIGLKGIHNYIEGTIRNYGSLSLKEDMGVEGLENYGDFINYPCGYAEIWSLIDNKSGAKFSNRGWLVNQYIGIHFNVGTMNNISVIEDNEYAFDVALNNKRVVVKPLEGPVQEGVPVHDVLEVDTLQDLTIVGIYTDETTSVYAGTYHVPSNHFIPNAAAVGLTSLYVKITDAVEYCTHIFEIEVPGGVQALSSEGTNAMQVSLQPAERQKVSDYLVFPNPTFGPFTLRVPKNREKAMTLEVMDLSGRKLLQKRIEPTSGTNHNLESLPKGMYLINLKLDGQITWQDKLVVMK